jgi:hypothetical protein
MSTKVSVYDYNEAVDQYLGWCTTCDDFTRDSTEGDAEDYLCEICEENSVMGAENALIMGIIELVEDEE